MNAFLHRNGTPSVAGTYLRQLSEQPGPLLASLIQVPPGGNSVKAYLDVAIEDAHWPHDLPQLLAVGNSQSMHRVDAEWALPGAKAANLLPAVDSSVVYQALAQAMRQLRPGVSNPALRILLEADPQRGFGGFSASLESDSSRRLAALHPVGWTASRIHVTHDIPADFAATTGLDFFAHLVEALTGMPLPHVASFGGIEWLRDGEVVHCWPSQ